MHTHLECAHTNGRYDIACDNPGSIYYSDETHAYMYSRYIILFFELGNILTPHHTNGAGEELMIDSFDDLHTVLAY